MISIRIDLQAFSEKKSYLLFYVLKIGYIGGFLFWVLNQGRNCVKKLYLYFLTYTWLVLVKFLNNMFSESWPKFCDQFQFARNININFFPKEKSPKEKSPKEKARISVILMQYRSCVYIFWPLRFDTILWLRLTSYS